MPSPDPAELLGDALVARILRSRGGQRLLAMNEQAMQQFLSSAESTLTIPSSENDAVKASIEEARVSAQYRCDLALKGGSVATAVGLVGAVTVLEERGYAFVRTAGASGGALVAALLAAGYASTEIREILFAVDSQRFVNRDPGLLKRAGRRNEPLALESLIQWMRELLARMGISTFADLRIADAGSSLGPERYRLVVYAADLGRNELVCLPADYKHYGLPPDEQPVAEAVAAALANQQGLEPIGVVHEDSRTDLGDAGALDSQLVAVFDTADGELPRWPTFGVRLSPSSALPSGAGPGRRPREPGSDEADEPANDTETSERDRSRTIVIPSGGLMPADGVPTREQAVALYDAGRRAAEQFLRGWDFASYVDTRPHGQA